MSFIWGLLTGLLLYFFMMIMSDKFTLWNLWMITRFNVNDYKDSRKSMKEKNDRYIWLKNQIRKELRRR